MPSKPSCGTNQQNHLVPLWRNCRHHPLVAWGFRKGSGKLELVSGVSLGSHKPHRQESSLCWVCRRLTILNTRSGNNMDCISDFICCSLQPYLHPILLWVRSGGCTFQWHLLATTTLGHQLLQCCRSCSTSWVAWGGGFLSLDWGIPDQHAIYRRSCADAEGKAPPHLTSSLWGCPWDPVPGPPCPTPALAEPHVNIRTTIGSGTSQTLHLHVEPFVAELRTIYVPELQWFQYCHRLRPLTTSFLLFLNLLDEIRGISVEYPWKLNFKTPGLFVPGWCKWEMALKLCLDTVVTQWSSLLCSLAHCIQLFMTLL